MHPVIIAQQLDDFMSSIYWSTPMVFPVDSIHTASSALHTCIGLEATQGDLTKLGEAAGLPAKVGAASVKVQHFASTRSVPWTGQRIKMHPA